MSHGFQPNSQLSQIAIDEAHAAQQDARRSSNEVERLRGDVERLFMVTEALGLLLKKNTATETKS
jgi:hypothetical protein